jgi:lipopolysaccharide export system protein LptA
MCISGENVKFSSRDDSWSFDKADLRDARGTRVTANTARGIERPGGLLEVDFTGKVHVEFRGAVLDADTATMVLRDEALVSVDVKGSQATFSHQPEKSKRRIDGKADAINYVAASGDMRFSGGTFWTNGSYTMNTPQLSYNLNSGDVSAPRSIGTVRPKGDSERVPAPRPPERSTAQ